MWHEFPISRPFQRVFLQSEPLHHRFSEPQRRYTGGQPAQRPSASRKRVQILFI
jgi:hypothetical protein